MAALKASYVAALRTIDHWPPFLGIGWIEGLKQALRFLLIKCLFLVDVERSGSFDYIVVDERSVQILLNLSYTSTQIGVYRVADSATTNGNYTIHR